MGSIKQIEIDINCPGCGNQLRERLANMKPGNSRSCTSCGTTLRYEGDDASEIERRLQRAIAHLEKACGEIRIEL